MTCLSLSGYLREKIFDETGTKFFEEASLNAIHKTLYAGGMTVADIMLLIGEMPKILQMNYPAVKNIRESLIQIIPQVMVTFRVYNQALPWKNMVNLSYILKLLKSFKI